MKVKLTHALALAVELAKAETEDDEDEVDTVVLLPMALEELGVGSELLEKDALTDEIKQQLRGRTWNGVYRIEIDGSEFLMLVAQKRFSLSRPCPGLRESRTIRTTDSIASIQVVKADRIDVDIAIP